MSALAMGFGGNRRSILLSIDLHVIRFQSGDTHFSKSCYSCFYTMNAFKFNLACKPRKPFGGNMQCQRL